MRTTRRKADKKHGDPIHVHDGYERQKHDGPTHNLRRKRTTQRWIRSTKIQRHVNDGYERKVQHKFYDKSERHVTTDSNDTMKDGPRRSDDDARHVNDGCERNGYI